MRFLVLSNLLFLLYLHEKPFMFPNSLVIVPFYFVLVSLFLKLPGALSSAHKHSGRKQPDTFGKHAYQTDRVILNKLDCEYMYRYTPSIRKFPYWNFFSVDRNSKVFRSIPKDIL